MRTLGRVVLWIILIDALLVTAALAGESKPDQIPLVLLSLAWAIGAAYLLFVRKLWKRPRQRPMA